MPLPRPASPIALWKDLRDFAAQRSRHQVIGAAVAILMPLGIIVAFVKDANTNIMPGEQLIYAESWSLDRTDEEIVAQQQIDQARREALAAERQRQFQQLARQFNIETE